ncbi:4085_t:CDS:2, partial [Acaulospora colombiana]
CAADDSVAVEVYGGGSCTPDNSVAVEVYGGGSYTKQPSWWICTAGWPMVKSCRRKVAPPMILWQWKCTAGGHRTTNDSAVEIFYGGGVIRVPQTTIVVDMYGEVAYALYGGGDVRQTTIMVGMYGGVKRLPEQNWAADNSVAVEVYSGEVVRHTADSDRGLTLMVLDLYSKSTVNEVISFLVGTHLTDLSPKPGARVRLGERELAFGRNLPCDLYDQSYSCLISMRRTHKKENLAINRRLPPFGSMGDITHLPHISTMSSDDLDGRVLIPLLVPSEEPETISEWAANLLSCVEDEGNYPEDDEDILDAATPFTLFSIFQESASSYALVVQDDSAIDAAVVSMWGMLETMEKDAWAELLDDLRIHFQEVCAFSHALATCNDKRRSAALLNQKTISIDNFKSKLFDKLEHCKIPKRGKKLGQGTRKRKLVSSFSKIASPCLRCSIGSDSSKETANKLGSSFCQDFDTICIASDPESDEEMEIIPLEPKSTTSRTNHFNSVFESESPGSSHVDKSYESQRSTYDLPSSNTNGDITSKAHSAEARSTGHNITTSTTIPPPPWSEIGASKPSLPEVQTVSTDLAMSVTNPPSSWGETGASKATSSDTRAVGTDPATSAINPTSCWGLPFANPNSFSVSNGNMRPALEWMQAPILNSTISPVSSFGTNAFFPSNLTNPQPPSNFLLNTPQGRAFAQFLGMPQTFPDPSFYPSQIGMST